jgi:8-oxo-dGTP diphosphatase
MYYGPQHPKTQPVTATCAGCFLEHAGKILLLRRAQQKPWGGYWGLPGGKAETGETPHEAMKRELWEETGIVHQVSASDAAGVIYVSFEPNQLIAFHMFRLALTYSPTSIPLRETEHSAWQWYAPLEAVTLPDLFPHTAECIEYVYRLRQGA